MSREKGSWGINNQIHLQKFKVAVCFVLQQNLYIRLNGRNKQKRGKDRCYLCVCLGEAEWQVIRSQTQAAEWQCTSQCAWQTEVMCSCVRSRQVPDVLLHRSQTDYQCCLGFLTPRHEGWGCDNYCHGNTEDQHCHIRLPEWQHSLFLKLFI